MQIEEVMQAKVIHLALNEKKIYICGNNYILQLQSRYYNNLELKIFLEKISDTIITTERLIFKDR